MKIAESLVLVWYRLSTVIRRGQWLIFEFSVPQIEYPLGGRSKKGSHVYFLLIVAMVLLLQRQIILLWYQVAMVASEQHLDQTIVQVDKTIVLPRKLTTGRIHDYIFCYCPVVGILFEVLRIIVHVLSCMVTDEMVIVYNEVKNGSIIKFQKQIC